MQQNQEQQPVILLKEGSERTEGREAQIGNIAAAKAVAQTIRTTLGPEGMDKMLVDTMGDVVITNDGSTILQEMGIEHPAARMMVEIAKTLDEEVYRSKICDQDVIYSSITKNNQNLTPFSKLKQFNLFFGLHLSSVKINYNDWS